MFFFFSSRRRHTRCALVTGVQTCALPILLMTMRALTEGARALVYYAAGLVDRAHLGDKAAGARLDLLTPLAKAYGTDIGVEVTSLGVQVHGGMGYIEETGAAQHYRDARIAPRSEEHTSELQSLMRISYAVFCLKKKKTNM